MNRRELIKKSFLCAALSIKPEIIKETKKPKYELAVLDNADNEITKRKPININKPSDIKIEFYKRANIQSIALIKNGEIRYKKNIFGTSGYYESCSKDITLNIHLDLPIFALED